jgi:isoquinoline 1-oxidoreductase alpha subunit
MISLTVNDRHHRIDAPEDMPLLWALRDIVGLKGTKFGCGAGLCGACTVHLNGEAVRSCQTTVAEARDGSVTTIEHIGTSEIGGRLLRAWQKIDVPQCGYCQPGQIMSASALLAEQADPDDGAIDDAMEGNICRCGTYNRIRAAIRAAARAGG